MGGRRGAGAADRARPRRRRRVLRLAVGLLVVGAFSAFGGLFMFGMPGRSHRGPVPALTPPQRDLRDRLAAHVKALAGEIGARSTQCPNGLRRAERYVEASFQALGYSPRADTFVADGMEVRNYEVSVAGTQVPEEIVLVGAHYDAYLDCPGANDNASGVAALLEIARAWRDRRPGRSLRFVAFTNEEPPHFTTPTMGSRVYAERARAKGDRIVAMLALETIGCYSDRPGSQHYPPPFGWFYPDTGNFIGFVGNLGSRSLVRRCVGAFRRHAAFPSEGVAAPGWLTGIGWSDHRSFWEAGYPGLMVTDTALFRYPHYHRPGDTPDRLDYESMARVVSGLAKVVEELAGPADTDGG